MKKKIAVAIPTFNREQTLFTAIDSLISQEYKNFDIHIFDNCSTDDTVKTIVPLLNNRIFLHKNNRNIGFVKNVNRCLALSNKYDWIGILHSDDRHIGESVQTLISAIERFPHVGFIFSEVHVINQFGKILKKPKVANNQLFKKGLDAVTRSLKHIPCSTTFYNSQVIKKLGVYDVKYPFSADEEYNNRISSQYDILCLSNPIGEHLIHEDNLRIETWLDKDFILNYKEMRYKMLEQTDLSKIEIKGLLNKQISMTCLDIASALSKNQYQRDAQRYNKLSWKYNAYSFLNPFNLTRSILIFFPNFKSLIYTLDRYSTDNSIK